MEIRNFIYNFSVDPKATGSKIKSLRKSQKMTAEMLADALLCSVKTVSSWETGTRFPSIDALVDLANLFDVSVHSLMLPLDNCSQESIKPISNEYDYLNPPYFVGDTSEKMLVALFTREEYLIQRFLCGVFTNKDACEYERLAYALMYPPEIQKSERQRKNTADEFWQFKKDHFYNLGKKAILFNRILRGEQLHNALRAMDLFERSVFLTMLCYFPEFRDWDCAEMLYGTGARFIDCQFAQNAEKIKQFALQKEQKKLFNVCVSTISSEEELLCFWDLDPRANEERKKDWFSYLEVPRYKDNPDYYNKRTVRKTIIIGKDNKEHKTLAAYYSLFDFITDTIKSLDDFSKRYVSSDLCFEAYLKTLLEKGIIK